VRRSVRGLAAIVAVSGLAGPGCRDDDREAGGRRLGLDVTDIAFADVGGEIDETVVRDSVAEAVRTAKRLAADPAAERVGSLRGRIAIGAIESPQGGPILRVELVADTPTTLHASVGSRLDATVELERVDGTLQPAEDVPLAVGRAVAVLDAKLVLAGADADDVRRLLADTDPEIVLLALEHVGRRRMRAVADDVAGLLPNDDDRVVAAAVECLGLVGSSEHTAVMLKHVRLADRAQAQRLYEALAVLGGDEAAAFLEFAARNEDDPALADVARGALRRLHAPAGTDGALPELRGHRP
jgi:hypothetical protein